jgi:hexokinase
VEQIRLKAIDFLKKYGMDFEDIDFESNVDGFVNEMKRGLAGQKSSLAMIPTFIEAEAEMPKNKNVIVMDAGGTNFRVATVYFDDEGKAVIEDFKLYAMPGAEGAVSKEKFFKTIAGYIRDVVDTSRNIGFCFSYATEITPNRDGRLIRFSKEIRADEVIGELIGENLNRALVGLGISSEKHVVLLNDTVATLLAGRNYRGRAFDGYIGFILGTGTNCCYVEKNSNILKQKGIDPSGGQIVNTESGGFDKCRRGQIDVLFDQSTANPGVHQFEKMVSGAYFGPLCLAVIHRASADKLFSEEAAKEFMKIERLETKDASDFLYYPYSSQNLLAAGCMKGNTDDTVKLSCLIERLVERAGKLAAINLSAAALKSEKGRNPDKPIGIVAEGTTFYHLKGLRNKTEFYLRDHLENRHRIYSEIISVENATLTGAAIAGLTN